MHSSEHQALVVRQFGRQAQAYVESSVHAQGEDLREIAAYVATDSQARVLDLGCGGGHVAFTVSPSVREVVAYDLSHEMLSAVAISAAERGMRNITTTQGSVERLPFDDASFDIVLTRFSAHHWSDVHAGLAEARRVVKPGGKAFFADIAAPVSPAYDTFLQAMEVLRDPSHVRNYSIAEWHAYLRRAGFAVTGTNERKLRLDFTTWIARMETPAVRADAIRSLQNAVSAETRAYFAIESDGTFTSDTMTITAA